VHGFSQFPAPLARRAALKVLEGAGEVLRVLVAEGVGYLGESLVSNPLYVVLQYPLHGVSSYPLYVVQTDP